ncbi:unnamed protein product [Gadus morhua 'NCC']
MISRSAGRGSVCFRLRCVSGWRFFVLHYSDSARRYSAEPGQRSRSEVRPYRATSTQPRRSRTTDPVASG